MHGAATSCDAHVTMYAAAQVKKGLEVAKRLGAENFVFWGGREGYHSLINTDVRAELDHLAAFYKMVIGKIAASQYSESFLLSKFSAHSVTMFSSLVSFYFISISCRITAALPLDEWFPTFL